MSNYSPHGNVLNEYGTNYTKLAISGEFDECFGREKELLELMEILLRKQKNNPVLVGDAGVGKTSVIELFATRIARNLVPFSLEGRIIISLNMNRILAGAKYRGQFEARFQKFLDSILSNPKIILFIDEIHTILGGSTESSGNDGTLNIAQMLKPILARGKLLCIGATTVKEYQIIEKDPALSRRFQPIRVNEPSIEDSIKILYALRPSLEVFHNVEISSEALKLAVDLSSRYIYDKHLPDKAIDIIDRAAAREVINYTNIENNSLITAVINASLNNLGRLKMEAFKSNNIPVVYILQQVEDAYKGVLLSWMDNPLDILNMPGNKNKENFISQDLIYKMKSSILRYVDGLLFTNNKIERYIKVGSNVKNIDYYQNKEIYSKVMDKLLNKENINLSLYRISVLLLTKWSLLDKNHLNKSSNIINNKISKTYIYLSKILKSDNRNLKFSSNFDFNVKDNKFLNAKNSLEITKIQILNDFLRKLKPILNKGIIASLNKSSEINLSHKELKIIYTLLGHSADNAKFVSRPIISYKNNRTHSKTKITEKHIYSLLTQITGIPLNFLSANMSKNLLNLEITLHQRVVGQEEAISAVAKAIRRSRLGIQNPKKPISSLLFCGPTGVGKTELTKALAACMFGTEKDLIRFDMSEFMEKHAVSRLIGSPPGYVGYEEGGQLTNAIRRNPYSVILFDEIEKAHPDVLNILLQILDDGRLTDTQKRLVKFDNTIIILTSNVGSLEIQNMLNLNNNIESSSLENSKIYNSNSITAANFIKSRSNSNFINDIRSNLNFEFENSFDKFNFKPLINISESKEFSKEQQKSTDLKKAVFNRLQLKFLPEFLNRLDDIIIFQPLNQEEIVNICEILINDLIDRIKLKNITLIVEDNVKFKLAKEGYNPAFGARPLKRIITKNIEDSITELLLKNISTEYDVQTIRVALSSSNKITTTLVKNN